MDAERNRVFAQVAQSNPDLADNTVFAVGYMLRDFIANMISDNQDADTGCGFGEFCIDFKADGKDCRVVVSLPYAANIDGGK